MVEPIRENCSKLQVNLPYQLIEFLGDVHDRIMTNDDTTTIPSDDLLQCECGYGGLDADGKQFSFVFFPEKGMRVRWEFKLLPDEIDELASGFRDKLIVNQFTRVD